MMREGGSGDPIGRAEYPGRLGWHRRRIGCDRSRAARREA